MAGDFPRSSSSLPVFFRVSGLGFSFGFRFQVYRFLGYGNRKLLGFGFQGSFEGFFLGTIRILQGFGEIVFQLGAFGICGIRD